PPRALSFASPNVPGPLPRLAMDIALLCINGTGSLPPFRRRWAPQTTCPRNPSLLGMQAVVLDANALLLPFQFRVNLEAELRRLLGEHEILVPSAVLDELKGLARSLREARSALKL